MYLFSRFPLGILGLVSVAVGVTMPFTLITAPLVYEPGITMKLGATLRFGG